MRVPKLPQDRLGFTGVSLGAMAQWRVLVLAAVALLLGAGIAWLKLPRLENPTVEFPRIRVAIAYPGASPEDVESQLLKPVERELYAMDGVEYVDSKAIPNGAQFELRFQETVNLENAAESVRGKILAKRKELPAEMGDPIVQRMKSATYAAQMVVAVTGNRADRILSDVATEVKDSIAGMDGVESVTVRGGRKRAVRIQLDPIRLAQHHLDVEQVIERIRLSNVRIPGGELAVGTLTTMLSVNQEVKSASEVGRIAVQTAHEADGTTTTVSLSDVADVRDDFKTGSERMLHDGIPAVGLEIRFRPEENALDVGKRVRAQIAFHRAALPLGVELRIANDQPAWVKETLSGFTESLVEGIFLVMVVITLGMGWRAATVVAVVLPLAIGGALFGLFSAGLALEQVSISSLILALGLLVDDAVVVTESIQLMRDRGLGKIRAAVLGASRVFWANNGTTAVACASFLPFFFMGGDTGKFIRTLPIVVLLALMTSLFVAQLLTPWISTFFLKSRAGVTPISDDTPVSPEQDFAETGEHERNAVLRALKGAYARAIPSIIAHPGKVIAVAVVVLAGAALLVPTIGLQFFPKADKPFLFVTVDLPRGTDETVTAQKVARVVAEIRKDKDVRFTSAMVGGPYPIVFMGRVPHPPSKDFADVLVQLDGPSTDAVVRRLRVSLASIPGIKTTVAELYHGPATPHPIMLRVEGDDYVKLRTRAEEIKAILARTPGTLNASETLSETVPLASVEIDADRALRLGVTPGQVGATLRSLYGEDKLTSFRQNGDTVDVVIDGAPTAKNPLDRVAQTTVTTRAGTNVPLLAVGDVKIKRGFAELQRRNTRRVVEISADVDGGTLPSKVMLAVKPELDKLTWEAGYSLAVAGEQAETEKSFRNLGAAAVGTLLLVFVLLVMMFKSLTRAMIVLAAVPFALIGAIGGLYLTNNSFGFMAFLGLIALIGVYVNHKIYFVDRMNELVARGMDWRAAIHQAGIDRLRPVVLTALTAILGLLPLTLGGGALWSAFGWVNIFGLATSIVLSLVLLPAFLAVSHRLLSDDAASTATSLDDVDAGNEVDAGYEGQAGERASVTLVIGGRPPPLRAIAGGRAASSCASSRDVSAIRLVSPAARASNVGRSKAG